MDPSALIHDLVLDLGATGLFLEIPVEPDTGPYLVTGIKGPVWVETDKAGVLRSGVVPGLPPTTLFNDLVSSIHLASQEREWGSSFPLTSVGLMDGEDYLFSYGFQEFDLLAPEGSPSFRFPCSDVTRSVVASWVPHGCALLIPTEREYLGFLGLLKDSYTAVVHNPSRGMVTFGPW